MNKLGGFLSLLFYCQKMALKRPAGSLLPVLNFTPSAGGHSRASVRIRDQLQEKMEHGLRIEGWRITEGVRPNGIAGIETLPRVFAWLAASHFSPNDAGWRWRFRDGGTHRKN